MSEGKGNVCEGMTYETRCHQAKEEQRHVLVIGGLVGVPTGEAGSTFLYMCFINRTHG